VAEASPVTVAPSIKYFVKGLMTVSGALLGTVILADAGLYIFDPTLILIFVKYPGQNP
jgi:hypothetical protein